MRTTARTCLISIAAALLGAAPSVQAAGFVVKVSDRNDDPIENVAAYLLPTQGNSASSTQHSPSPGLMVQNENRFVPHVLIVETGAEVSFPNDDTVSHHVYSFSEAKRFQLDLYRGNTHPPQLFDIPGLVVLGCNIHDSMLGYILVVDTPWYGVSNAAGTATVPGLPAGEYELHIWTPRADPDELPAPQIVTFDGVGERVVSVRLSGKLRPPHDAHGGSLSWDAY